MYRPGTGYRPERASGISAVSQQYLLHMFITNLSIHVPYTHSAHNEPKGDGVRAHNVERGKLVYVKLP